MISRNTGISFISFLCALIVWAFFVRGGRAATIGANFNNQGQSQAGFIRNTRLMDLLKGIPVNRGLQAVGRRSDDLLEGALKRLQLIDQMYSKMGRPRYGKRSGMSPMMALQPTKGAIPNESGQGEFSPLDDEGSQSERYGYSFDEDLLKDVKHPTSQQEAAFRALEIPTSQISTEITAEGYQNGFKPLEEGAFDDSNKETATQEDPLERLFGHLFLREADGSESNPADVMLELDHDQERNQLTGNMGRLIEAQHEGNNEQSSGEIMGNVQQKIQISEAAKPRLNQNFRGSVVPNELTAMDSNNRNTIERWPQQGGPPMLRRQEHPWVVRSTM